MDQSIASSSFLSSLDATLEVDVASMSSVRHPVALQSRQTRYIVLQDKTRYIAIEIAFETDAAASRFGAEGEAPWPSRSGSSPPETPGSSTWNSCASSR